jgi:hypothetical protein
MAWNDLDRAIGKALDERRPQRTADTTKTYTSMADAFADHMTPKKETTDDDD